MVRVQAIYAGHVLKGTASFEEVPPDHEEMCRRWEAVLAAKLPYLVAERGGEVVGYAYATRYRPRSAYRYTAEDSVYVDPAAIGGGIGRTLLTRVLELSAASGYREMIAVIGDSANTASIGLHRALGFSHVGTLTRVGFKFGRWLDSVLMQRSLYAAGLLAMAVALGGAEPAHAQAYPAKPVRIVVTGVGSGGDFAARLIAQGVSPALGQQIIVDNRGSGNLPAEIVAKSAPDGYTLCLSAAPLWITPFLRKTPYDPEKDFAPVTLVVTSPNILVVHPSLPVHSVKALIALIRARPGQLNYATSGIGGSGFLAAELFKSMARADMVRVNYKSGGLALTELMSGEVQLFFANAGAVAPHMKSGRLRALAVTSAQPSVLLPGLPTVAAGGLPGYELVSVQGIFAPARTPEAVVARLNQEIVPFLKRADVKEKFFAAGMEPLGSAPEALAATVKSEMNRLGKVIKAAGIALEP